MGLFDSFLGPKHPPLDGSDPAAAMIARAGKAFESFVASANDAMEAVPGDGCTYVFVGKPPKAFGVVWFDGDERHDVRSMMEKGRMTRDAAGGLVNDLSRLYVAHSAAERFSHSVDGHKITVTPSAEFFSAIDSAVAHATSA